MSITQTDFIELWNNSVSTFQVAEAAGTTRMAAVTRACKLRRKGYALRRMKKNQDPDRAGLRSQAAIERDTQAWAELSTKVPEGFFRDFADTSWVWMAQKVGLDVKTLRKIAKERGFKDKVAGVKKVEHFQCSTLVRNYIDGLLLSDASLRGAGRRSFRQESVSQDWLVQVQQQFDGWGIRSSITPVMRPGRNLSFVLETPVYQTFGIFGRRWYGDTKKVPRDLDLQSTALLRNLYLGDGTMAGNVLEICVEGFSDKDVEWLQVRLNRNHNLNIVVRRVRAGLRLKIYARWRNQFFDLIEWDVPPSLQHRFKRSTGRYQK